MLQSDDDDVRIFVGDEAGPDKYVAFFEDNGETGDLYVCDRANNDSVVQHLQVYVNSQALRLREEDVQVLWSQDGTKCGVMISAAIRGIIDIARSRNVKAPMSDRSALPISDPEWLAGFNVTANS